MNKVLTIRMPEWELAELKEYAQVNQIAISTLVRSLISDKLEDAMQLTPEFRQKIAIAKEQADKGEVLTFDELVADLKD